MKEHGFFPVKRWEAVDDGIRFEIEELANGLYRAAASEDGYSENDFADIWASYRRARRALYTSKRFKSVPIPEALQ